MGKRCISFAIFSKILMKRCISFTILSKIFKIFSQNSPKNFFCLIFTKLKKALKSYSIVFVYSFCVFCSQFLVFPLFFNDFWKSCVFYPFFLTFPIFFNIPLFLTIFENRTVKKNEDGVYTLPCLFFTVHFQNFDKKGMTS